MEAAAQTEPRPGRRAADEPAEQVPGVEARGRRVLRAESPMEASVKPSSGIKPLTRKVKLHERVTDSPVRTGPIIGGDRPADLDDDSWDSDRRSRRRRGPRSHEDHPSPKKRKEERSQILFAYNVGMVEVVTHHSVKALWDQIQPLLALGQTVDRMAYFSQNAKFMVKFRFGKIKPAEYEEYSDAKFFSTLLRLLGESPHDTDILRLVSDIHLKVAFHTDYVIDFTERISRAFRERGRELDELTANENKYLIDHYRRSLIAQMGDVTNPKRPSVQRHAQFIDRQMQAPSLEGFKEHVEETPPTTFYQWLINLDTLAKCVARYIHTTEVQIGYKCGYNNWSAK